MRYLTDKVFMVSPVWFDYNQQTATNNAFMNKSGGDVQSLALGEFNDFVESLRNSGIEVVCAKDTMEPHTPDSIFPNNWFSCHDDGTLVLYPMYAPNRRRERKSEFVDLIKNNFSIERVVDLTYFEEKNLFLEGTGSLVLDRANKIAYACKSPRTSEVVLAEFCNLLGYQKVVFSAVDEKGQAIYHTNVMMNMGIDYAMVCLDSIENEIERDLLIKSLSDSGKEIIDFSLEQLHNFVGNMLQLNNGRENILVLSKSAYDALNVDQKIFLERRNKLVLANISTIETNGGGSARCMVAELF